MTARPRGRTAARREATAPSRRAARATRWALAAAPGVVGAAAGLLLLHPVSMAVYWFEFHPAERTLAAAWRFVGDRLALGVTPGMLPMSGVFAVVGGVLGVAFGLLSRALARQQRVVDHLERELRRDIDSLLAQGESERVEFKASTRWDYREQRANRALEDVVARTIAGFMNHQGGSVLIGVDDAGVVLGLEADYATLKRPNRDGLQQFLAGLVASHLGADLCPLTHVLFHDLAGKDVCRVVVEPSRRPVYVRERGTLHYVLRAGNTCRELDIREAMAHVAVRWPV